MLLDFIRLILQDINRRKFSSFLTLFAISLGILTIFVIFLLGEGFENSVAEQFEALGTNRLYISSATQSLGSTTAIRGLSDNEVNLIENRPYVDTVYPYYARQAQIEYSKQFVSTQVLGTTIGPDFFESFDLEAAEGRLPKENEKFAVVIGPVAASDRFDKEIPVGANLYVKGTKFKVVGILESLGNNQDDSTMYFNIDTVRDLFDGGDSVGFLDVVLVEGYDIELAEANLLVLLENKLGEDSVEIISPLQLLEQFNSILGIVKGVLGGIAFVSLVVGALGIINTMYVIVTEKRKDIGIMKSIGARNEDILFMYVFQAGLFGFLGSILGVFFGSFLALGFGAVAQQSGFGFLKVTLDPVIALSLLAFGFVVGALSGFVPAYKASKTNIMESIRS